MNELKEERKIKSREMTPKEKEEFEKAYKELYPQIYKYLFKIFKNQDEAEEIAQETFAKYYERPDSYNNKAYTLKSFLLLSAKCRAITYLRKNQRRAEIVQERKFELMGKDDGSESYEKRIEHYDQEKAILEALENLRPNYRDAIIEVYIKKKSHKEAAEALGISKTNLKVTIHRAKIKLGEELEKKGFKDYFINFLIIGLIVFGLTCTYNFAIKRLFKIPKAYTYNDNGIAVNFEILEKYKYILDALNIVNDGNIKTQYIPVNRDNQDVLEIYNDDFKLKLFNREIMDFLVRFESDDYTPLKEVNEDTILELDKVLFGDEIREVKTVANIDYKMVNVIVNDEEYRIYIVSNDNKIMKIRNMTQFFVENTVEFDKENVTEIVKEEYGDNIEIKSIELTQTKLNVLIDEGEKEEYHEVESIDKYKDINLAYKNFNFYLVWKISFIENNKNINKENWIFIDVYDGKILKSSTYLEENKKSNS